MSSQSVVSNRTTSESYVGVTRSLAAPLRFLHGPPCHGEVEEKTHVQCLNGGYRSIAHDCPTEPLAELAQRVSAFIPEDDDVVRHE